MRIPRDLLICMPAHADNVINPGAQVRTFINTKSMFEQHKTRMCLSILQVLNSVTNPSLHFFIYSVNISMLSVYGQSQGHGPGMSTKMRRSQGTSCQGKAIQCEKHGVWSQKHQGLYPGWLLLSCVTLGKSLNLSGSLVPHL